MKYFKDKVAVITGAASGIGQGLAYKCGKEGMKLIISDIDEKRLRRTERKLKREGTSQVVSVLCDVSKPSDVENLAKITMDTYGVVNLLFNNAGIAIPRLIWEYNLQEWNRVISINLMGVIHGIHIFLPIMFKQNTECHIVNTASMEGIISRGIGGATYGVCKHAVVHLTERLAFELEENGFDIKVSVLCPGLVKTNIFLSALSNVPEESRTTIFNLEEMSEERIAELEQFMVESPSITPEEVAEITFNAIENEDLYIFTHKDSAMRGLAEDRWSAILQAFED
ncbi:MAG: SDR family NAD(P)-dependent oxidoreductase [Promethearchaeota archaeon]